MEREGKCMRYIVKDTLNTNIKCLKQENGEALIHEISDKIYFLNIFNHEL